MNRPPRVMDTDLCVIGAGSGGLSVAAGAAQMGARVVLIEKGRMGGDCLNFGCVPSKALLAAAKRAAVPREGLGVRFAAPDIDFAAAQAHVKNVIAAIAPHDSEERFQGLGVTVIRAAARFRGAREILAGEHLVRAKRVVIATGSRPAVPPIPGLEDVPYLTNESIFDLEARPEHLIVIGGGPIGMEMAQAFRRLGAGVTVIELMRLMPKDDPEAAGIVIQKLRDEGVRLLEGVAPAKVVRRGEGVAVTVETEGSAEVIEGSHLLVAAGRTANVDGLNLEAAGVAHTKKGIQVDARLRTTNHRVFAVGDVTGGYQFTHMAGHQAGIVIRNALFRLPAKEATPAVPWVTYTDPELAQVGMTEAAARAVYGDVTVISHPFAEVDRAVAEGRTTGFLKVVADRKGRIRGATLVGGQAGELIQPWILAMSTGLKLKHMAGYIAPYPTRGEISKRVAGRFFEPLLFGRGVRRLVRFLLKLP